jgi:hypothetical protein
MRFRDKIGPLHDPILKPAILPDFLAVARKHVNPYGTFTLNVRTESLVTLVDR